MRKIIRALLAGHSTESGRIMNERQRRMAAMVLGVGGLAALASPAHAAEKSRRLPHHLPDRHGGSRQPLHPRVRRHQPFRNGPRLHHGVGRRGRIEPVPHPPRDPPVGRGRRRDTLRGGRPVRRHTRIEDGVVYITADTRTRLTSQGADPNSCCASRCGSASPWRAAPRATRWSNTRRTAAADGGAGARSTGGSPCSERSRRGCDHGRPHLRRPLRPPPSPSPR